MNIDVESLERATLDAVAPPEVLEIKGWLLPMDRSTIGRAISAVPTSHHGLDPQSIESIETIYRSRGLTAQFRVADVASCSSIHQELRMRGYVALQPTLTQLAHSVQGSRGDPGHQVSVSSHPTEAWKSVYLAEGFDPIDGLNRVNALSRSAHVRYAWIQREGDTVASGTASNSHGWIGIHGLRTVEMARGQGLASEIIFTFADAIRNDGYRGMYLQVEEKNAGAVRLYEKLGFSTAWRYHYWKKV